MSRALIVFALIAIPIQASAAIDGFIERVMHWRATTAPERFVSSHVSWSSTGWPDLTGATVTFGCQSLSATGSVVTPTGTAVVQVELTAAQTATLTGAIGEAYGVQAVLTNSRVVTLVRGKANILADNLP